MKSSPQPRAHLAHLQPAQHGGPDYGLFAELGLAPEQVLDFSVNANPYGPSPHVLQALAAVRIDRYPDSRCLQLAEALAARHGVACRQVMVGNGSVELIRLLAMAYLDAGDACVIVEPTFGEYRSAAELAGAEVRVIRGRQDAAFVPAIEELVALVRRMRPRLIYLCNPNNPTGLYLPQHAVEAIAGACPGALLAVDLAYEPFVATPWAAEPLLARGNVALLHSMTKAEALAGLRLGYLLAPEAVINPLRILQGPWSVNAAAQTAGLAALADRPHLRWTLAAAREQKDALVRALLARGLAALPSTTHYFLVEVGDAAAWKRALLGQGILVRDCTSFGLPSYIRLAARRPQDNARLLEAIDHVQKQRWEKRR